MNTPYFGRFAVVALLLTAVTSTMAQTPVLTRSYDNGRTGSNTSESIFTPALVQNKGMRLLKSLRVDDDPRIEAQPLYVPGFKRHDKSIRNVVLVATMANQVWAFDADAPEGRDLLWKRSLGTPLNPAAGVQEGGKCSVQPGNSAGHRCTDVDWWGINIHWGILSTPVIDLDTSSLFVADQEVDKDGHLALWLHHLRLEDGQPLEKKQAVSGSLKGADGKPALDAKGNVVQLHPDQKIRAALLLAPLHGPHKTLFLATTGGENPGDPHGWIVAFDVDTFRETASWVSTPSSFGGGIWQGGQGLAADEDGNVYAMTGNGGYVNDNAGQPRDFEGDTDFAEAFLKLKYQKSGGGAATLALEDWFIPFKDSQRQHLGNYDYRDQDLGSAAPVVPPAGHVVLGAGKDGLLYALDRAHLGKSVSDLKVLQSMSLSYVTFNGLGLPTNGGVTGHDMDFDLGNPGRFPNKTHHLHGSPVYWEGPDRPMIFTWGENESLRAWKFDPVTRTTTFIGKGAQIASAKLAAQPTGMGGMTGGMLTLSSNGKVPDTGIVWSTAPIDGDANHDVVEGIARAYDATRLSDTPIDSNTPGLKLLWGSKQSGVSFNFSKFCPPVVADGRLFVPTYDGRVDVYGLKP